jgi:hypothetical protein
MFIDTRSRRLGDLAAGTLVIHDQGPVSLETLAPKPVPAAENGSAGEPSALGFPLERLSRRDLQLIEDYAQRREELANRELLAGQILKRLCEQTGLQSESFPNPDETLSALASAIRKNQTEKEQK